LKRFYKVETIITGIFEFCKVTLFKDINTGLS